MLLVSLSFFGVNDEVDGIFGWLLFRLNVDGVLVATELAYPDLVFIIFVFYFFISYLSHVSFMLL